MNDLLATNVVSKTEITLQDREVIRTAMPNIAKAFEDAQIFRTAVEFEISVLNDAAHPSADAKYWQCHLELKTHSDQLIHADFNLKLKRIEIEEINDELCSMNSFSLFKRKNKHSKQKKQIELERESYNLQLLERVAKDRIREISQIDAQMKKLKDECVYSTTDKEEHQYFSYIFKFATEYKAAITAKGANSGEVRNAEGHLKTCFDRIWNDPEKKAVFQKVCTEPLMDFLIKIGLIITEE